MKLNDFQINRLETENGVILLSRLQKEQQYLYVKVSKRYPEKIFTLPITMQNGKIRNIKFVKSSDIEFLKQDESFHKKEPQPQRGVRGRPYGFCKDCEKRDKRNELKKSVMTSVSGITGRLKNILYYLNMQNICTHIRKRRDNVKGKNVLFTIAASVF